jgi:16S rRNA (cytosine967-C5)-methyltransferase
LPTRTDHQRASAARMLAGVVAGGQTSDQVLARAPADPLTRELFYGAMRHYFALGEEVDSALTRPLRKKDEIIRFLLIVGAYQLRYTRIPDHAAINETVNACKALKKTSTASLVNGVLRSLQRKSAQTERSFEDALAHEYPDWMSVLIHRDYGELAQEILQACLIKAPLTLRVNQRRSTPENYRGLLDAKAIGYQPAYSEEYLVLDQAYPTDSLPGFDTGLVAVQDAGAGFAAKLLAPASGARVLDACAAPGGKLFHLMECQPDIDALAVELSATRMERLINQAQLLGHAPTTIVADATNLDWWNGSPFDAVLLDAPCSGSGTLRRHPDIKILRNAADLPGYSQLQSQLLTNLWRTVRPGGSLLYCTCSLFAEENDTVVSRFLAANDNAIVEDISLPTGIPRDFGWQLLPTDPKTDGFYFSLLTKEPK